MRRTILVLMGGLVVALPPVARSAELQKHERHEEKRIDRGEHRGSLTDKEAAKLEGKEDAIEEERRVGKITKREHKSIRHEQKELSQDIYRKKHNKKHE